MKSFFAAGVAAAALAGAASAQDAVIHAGRLLATPGEDVLTERSVIVEDGRIAEVVEGYVERDGVETIDLTGMTVLPGLIDSHVHLLSESNPNSRLETVELEEADLALDGARHARTTLEAGFTTVRDVGGSFAIFALRDAIAAGDVPGPRILASGPAITPTGGHGDVHGYREDVSAGLRDGFTCDGVADCRRATREVIRAGADVVKITATGGVLSNTAAGVERQFFDDELEAIVETAAMMGREVTAHAHGTSGINAALRAGVASIEHGSYLDAESIRLFRRNDAVLVPTILAGVTVTEWVGEPWFPAASAQKAAEVGPVMLDMARRAHEGGVTIAFGTDTGVSAHGENARELALMVEAGFTPAEAIAAATVVAAEHVDLADEIGTIEAGKAADIIAVQGDPLTDVAELEAVDFVMKGGVVYVGP